MIYRNKESFKEEQFLSALDRIEFNGHAYISGSYETKNSPLVVFLPNTRGRTRDNFYKLYAFQKWNALLWEGGCF